MIDQRDLEAVERWLRATLDHCGKLRSQQRHQAAQNCAYGAIKLVRALHATEADHGFFADFLTQPFAGRFEEFT